MSQLKKNPRLEARRAEMKAWPEEKKRLFQIRFDKWFENWKNNISHNNNQQL